MSFTVLESIVQCVDKALDTFGEGVKEVVYFKMKQSINLERQDIPERPREFEAFLETMFGMGATRVQRAIMKEIVFTFQLERASSLADSILAASHKLLRNESRRPIAIQMGSDDDV